MGLVSDLARQGKDKALSKALEVLGESIISPYGRLLGLRLDSLTRSIGVELMLKGEDVPVTLTIEEYRFTTEGDKSYVIISNVSVSREWMKILAENLLKDRKFEIPSKYARLLDALI